jgi:hypothetical protein
VSGLERRERLGCRMVEPPYARTPYARTVVVPETLVLPAYAPAPTARENRSHRRGPPLISSIGESPESQKILRALRTGVVH